ncbi:MAG: lipopolysaccharide transport periplasmic protein LptA [Gammaproteobacteria bacterium]|nr:lipopolysaccharide transport periplasmic protein LptA [Gammaproteobacteria bacterium]
MCYLQKQRANILNSFFTKIIIITLLTVQLSPVSAQNVDQGQPIFLESDSAKWDENSQKSTYRGNVKVTQGSMKLTGDILIVTTKNSKIERMVMNGDKATYKQKTRNGKRVFGEAKKIDYTVANNTIVFLRDSVLTQGENIVKSNKIIYKTDTENIFAGDKDGKSRVRMTLEPENSDE